MRFLGVLSGTSADGIDIALADFADGISLIDFDTLPFPDSLQQALRQLPGRHATLSQLGPLQQQLDTAFADAVNAFLARHERQAITAIGFHGQTLWHDPTHGFSVQLGSPDALAAATGLPVVAGFRQSDLALGGQGAPLAPLFHAELCRDQPRPCAFVNIGGIANVSLIDDSGVTGWDTGPGNGILDEIAQRHFDQPFDRDGRIAASGQVDEAALATLLRHPYFSAPPPKSTGREQFNLHWLERTLERPLPPEDLMATATALTAAALAHDLAPHRPQKVFISGGGAENPVLMARIRDFLSRFGGGQAATPQKWGRPRPDAVEGLLFTWLAWKRWTGQPLDYTGITGARQPGLYGALHLPKPMPEVDGIR